MSIYKDQMLVEIQTALCFPFLKHTLKVTLCNLLANKIWFQGNLYSQKYINMHF